MRISTPGQSTKEKISSLKTFVLINDAIRSSPSKIEPALNSDVEMSHLTPAKWRVLIHSTCVILLYAALESYINNLVRIWCSLITRLVSSYEDLPPIITKTHSNNVAYILQNLNRRKYKRFGEIDVLRGLYQGLTNGSVELLPEAFLLGEANYRKEIIENTLTNAGMVNPWKWVKDHPRMIDFVSNSLGNQSTIESELNILIEYRNDAAHGNKIDNILSKNELIKYIDLIDRIAGALDELLLKSFTELALKEGIAKEAGIISEFYSKHNASIIKLDNGEYKVGQEVILLSSNQCFYASVKSICDNNVDLKILSLSSEAKEIGFCFEPAGKKNMRLMILT